MEIFKFNTPFVKMFSQGKEKEYKGKSIVYEKNTAVFVYLYYKSTYRFYIMKEEKKGLDFPYIYEKIRIVCKIELKEYPRARKCIKYMIELDDKIYTRNDIYYSKLEVLLKKRNVKKEDIKIFYLINRGS